MGRLQRREAGLSATTPSPDRHRTDELAIALRRAAHDADVELARSYARRVAAMAKGDPTISVTAHGPAL